MALQDLLKRFLGDEPEQQLDADARLRLAGAVLLLEIAQSDFELDARELAAVEQALGRQFQLAPEAAQQLIDQARAEHADSTSLEPYVRVLNQQCGRQERRDLLHGLWQVAHADGLLHAHEEHMMRRIADMLYLSHADFIQAKLAVLGPDEG